MTPHEEQYPRCADPDVGQNQGMVPILLGVVAIGLVGVLVLTASS